MLPTCPFDFSDLTLKKFNQKFEIIVQKTYMKYVSKTMRLFVKYLDFKYLSVNLIWSSWQHCDVC